MKMKIMRIMLPLITLSVIGMIAVVLVGCLPEEPARDGYDFGGWYTESECINKFDATVKGENDINLFAKWKKIN